MNADEILAVVREYNRVHHPRPCPGGCGCIDEEDPDRFDCACSGPCTMDAEWPYLREEQ